MMIPVENCTGCSACSTVCSQNAIVMEENMEGFLFPVINHDKCNHCGLCFEKCPLNNVTLRDEQIAPKVYAAWTKDTKLLSQSTSGGIFSELAKTVLDKNGVIFGAAYDANMVVRHIHVNTYEDLNSLRGSKYVQSDIANSYHLAKDYLEKGSHVLFTGTPCQVAGLYAALGKNYENLLTCDFICHGVPSPKVFRKYLAELESSRKSKVINVNFRDKKNGWKYPSIKITFDNKTAILESNLDNHYNLGFLKNMILRESCYSCPYKEMSSLSDITIGDFWELIKYQPSLINPQGTSALLINTPKGHLAVNSCLDCLEMTECPYEYLKHDSNLRKSATIHPDRSAFFAELDNLSFASLTKKYIKPRNKIVSKIAQIRRAYLKRKTKVTA